MAQQIKKLAPIKETLDDFDECEEKIRQLFRREIYYPILRDLSVNQSTLKNSKNDLLEALRTGRVTYNHGKFSGRFSSTVSKELKSLGARWDRKQGTWNIPQSKLPLDVRMAISVSTARFERTVSKIDRTLSKILPAEIADKLHVSKIFDTTLWKTDRDVKATLKSVSIPPDLTKKRVQDIADDWENNLKLYIKKFSEEEIASLRKKVKESVFAGNRYGSLVKTIQRSYEVSENKARFLARQETGLLMAKFKASRYKESGIDEYQWACVAGSKNHPVRPWHKALENKIFRWDDPPVTTKPGEAQRRNNPGEDYNCRCYPIPIVRFGK